MDNATFNQYVCRVSQAYIFTQLYKKGFIQSKEFTFTFDAIDLQSKLLHIIKSSINKELDKLDSQTEIFGKIITDKISFSAKILMNNSYGRFNIFKGRAKIIQERTSVDLYGVMTPMYSDNNLCYRFSDFMNIVHPLDVYNDERIFNLKEDLDSVVDCIINIPKQILELAVAIKSCNNIDKDYQYTIMDIVHYLANIQSPETFKLKNIFHLAILQGTVSADTILEIPLEYRENMDQLTSDVYWIETDQQKALVNYLQEEAKKINGTAS